ncbi:MAG: hypothetical protein WEC58_00370, partial [Candidatus Paceibacterota bacterium]
KLEERLGDDAQTFLDNVADHPDAVFRIEQQYGESNVTDRTVEELFQELDIELLIQRRDRIRHELQEAGRDRDDERVAQKMKAYQELQAQIDRMRQPDSEKT